MTVKRTAILLILLGVGIALFPRMREISLRPDPTPVALAREWTLPIPLKVTTLDPQTMLSGTEKSLSSLFCGRLVKINEHLQVEPDLLDSWDFNVRHKSYRFYLKRGIQFHDGTPVTTSDVLYSFHRWASPGSLDNNLLFPISGATAYSKREADTIAGIKVIDNFTFEVKLDNWEESFVRNLSMPRFCVLPKDLGGKHPAQFFTAPIGTGPYRLVSYDPERIEYEAHAGYHFGPPKTPRITVRYLPYEDAVVAFQRGSIDNLAMYDIFDPTPFARPRVVAKQMALVNTYSIIMNNSLPWFGELANRAWVNSLIDRHALLEECFRGSFPATTFIPPGMIGAQLLTPERDATKPPVAQDPPKPAGPVPPDLTLYVIDHEGNRCIKEAVSRQLQDSGIRVASAPLSELYEKLLAGKLYLWIESFEFKNEDPISNLQYFSTASQEYLLGSPIPDLEGLFGQLHAALTTQDKADLYTRIDEYLVAQSRLAPLVHMSNYLIYRDNVHNIEFLKTRRFVSHWHKVYVEDVAVSE